MRRRTVLIAGAARGIGQAVAAAFEAEGAADGFPSLVYTASPFPSAPRLLDLPRVQRQTGWEGEITAALELSRSFAARLIRSGRPGGIILGFPAADREGHGPAAGEVLCRTWEALTRQLADELHSAGITVSGVSLPAGAMGAVDTTPAAPGGPRDSLAKYAELYLFLAGEEGRSFSGRIIDADDWLRDPFIALRCRRGTVRLDPPFTDAVRVSLGNMAVNPLGPSPAVRQGLGAPGLAEAAGRYPEIRPPELLRRLALRHGLRPENVVLGAGSVELIRQLWETFGEEGGEVVHAVPGFAQVPNLCRMQGMVPVGVPLRWGEGAEEWGQHDLPAMLAKVRPRTRFVYLINPHNPTGALIPAEVLRDFISRVPAGVMVVVDEAYHDYLEESEAQGSSAASLVAGRENLVVLRTFSKAAGLAGLRVAYALSAEAATYALARRRIPFSVTALSLRAAAWALDDGDHLARTRLAIGRAREWLRQETGKLGVRMMPSRTNLVMFQADGDVQALVAQLKQRQVTVSLNPLVDGTFLYSIGDEAENRRFLDGLAEFSGPAS